MIEPTWSPAASLLKLATWAEKHGCRVKLGAPLTAAEIDAIGGSLKPHFGATSFVPPPSYRAFLATASSLKLQVRIDDDWETVSELDIYAPKEVARVTRSTVHVPKGVAFDNGRAISTNHLVGVAGTRSSPDGTLCFDTRKPDAAGEYPLVFHDQDEPVHAAFLDDGTSPYKGTFKPKAASFGAWFDASVAAIVKKKPGQLDV
jgi:hypothetical protein